MRLLKRGTYGEEAEIPRVILCRLEPHGSNDGAAFWIAMNEEVCFGFGGEVLAEESIRETRSCDDSGFNVPARNGTMPAIGGVDEFNDLRILSFGCVFEEHAIPIYSASGGNSLEKALSTYCVGRCVLILRE